MFIPAVLLLLMNCSSLPKTEEDKITRPFTSADAVQAITIAPNRLFTVELQSNPTTGYEWELQIEPSGIVTQKSKEYLAHSSGRIGTGGVTHWTFAARKKGSATLTFRYLRPWESNVPATREIVFTFNVR